MEIIQLVSKRQFRGLPTLTVADGGVAKATFLSFWMTCHPSQNEKVKGAERKNHLSLQVKVKIKGQKLLLHKSNKEFGE